MTFSVCSGAGGVFGSSVLDEVEKVVTGPTESQERERGDCVEVNLGGDSVSSGSALHCFCCGFCNGGGAFCVLSGGAVRLS